MLNGILVCVILIFESIIYSPSIQGWVFTVSGFASDGQVQIPVNPGAKAENTIIDLWNKRMPNLPRKVSMSTRASEDLPSGADSKWVEWKWLNRLRVARIVAHAT